MRHPKTSLPACALALLLGLFALTQAHAASRIVRVGVYENEPKVFLDENGAPSGIFIELLEAIAQDEGWELEYVPGTWDEGLSRLSSGEIDLMPDVAYTPERDEQYDFNRQRVAESWSYVYMTDGGGVDGISDLEGMRIAVLSGSIQEDALARITEGFGIDVDIVPTDSLRSAFELTSIGDADAAVANHFFGDYAAAEYGLEKTPIVFGGSSLHYAVGQGADAELLTAIDRHLTRWIDQPGSVYYTTLAHYAGDGGEARMLRTTLRWLVGVALALLLAVVVIVVSQWQVNVRTRDLKRAQVELEQHKDHLETLVEERTAQLEQANEDLAGISRSKSEFLAFMSHEFRNELNSILGFSSLMLANPTGLDAEHKKQVRYVQSSAERLHRLINDVLDLSKAESGAVKMTCEHVDLTALVRELLDSFGGLAAGRGNTLRAELPAVPLTLDTDEGIVRQILLNLVGNALKFTDDGAITVALIPIQDGALIEVRDTGKGITPAEMEHLFDEFWQSVDARRRAGIGTGLGLSICMNLATVLGGRIEVESELGVGSTFRLVLPGCVPHVASSSASDDEVSPIEEGRS